VPLRPPQGGEGARTAVSRVNGLWQGAVAVARAHVIGHKRHREESHKPVRDSACVCAGVNRVGRPGAPHRAAGAPPAWREKAEPSLAAERGGPAPWGGAGGGPPTTTRRRGRRRRQSCRRGWTCCRCPLRISTTQTRSTTGQTFLGGGVRRGGARRRSGKARGRPPPLGTPHMPGAARPPAPGLTAREQGEKGRGQRRAAVTVCACAPARAPAAGAVLAVGYEAAEELDGVGHPGRKRHGGGGEDEQPEPLRGFGVGVGAAGGVRRGSWARPLRRWGGREGPAASRPRTQLQLPPRRSRRPRPCARAGKDRGVGRERPASGVPRDPPRPPARPARPAPKVARRHACRSRRVASITTIAASSATTEAMKCLDLRCATTAPRRPCRPPAPPAAAAAAGAMAAGGWDGRWSSSGQISGEIYAGLVLQTRLISAQISGPRFIYASPLDRLRDVSMIAMGVVAACYGTATAMRVAVPRDVWAPGSRCPDTIGFAAAALCSEAIRSPLTRHRAPAHKHRRAPALPPSCRCYLRCKGSRAEQKLRLDARPQGRRKYAAGRMQAREKSGRRPPALLERAARWCGGRPGWRAPWVHGAGDSLALPQR
jgi:hypothetical protein